VRDIEVKSVVRCPWSVIISYYLSSIAYLPSNIRFCLLLFASCLLTLLHFGLKILYRSLHGFSRHLA
jgi:hypothetical protein